MHIFLDFVKKHTFLQCTTLLDLFVVDYPNRNVRFEAVYVVVSVRFSIKLIVKVFLEHTANIGTVSFLFPSAGWLEREVWDMYGIFFLGHNDLRRILTDYGFEGFPLRKDFPLTGYLEIRYDDEAKKVLVEPLEMTQEFRYFDFISPWENLK